MMQGFLVGYYMEPDQDVVQVFTGNSVTCHWFKQTVPSAPPFRVCGKLLVTITIKCVHYDHLIRSKQNPAFLLYCCYCIYFQP